MSEQMPLSAREVYQVLKDVAQGVRQLVVLSVCKTDLLTIRAEIDGWQLTLRNEEGSPLCCEYCMAPDGREGSLQHWHRCGTDPAAFLSGWEHSQLERALKNL
ncbi:hypothetical protein NJC40_20735 [Pseudomonas sp. 21LCFQ02]|uniref:DUF7693 family protein n=1 Tax=unclassified Pseudomonas TaxID=196821 RepID=UPI0004F8FC44|nr:MULTISPECIES: hypothetical protein [unclassified Pseudomonas]MCO8162862.1 hypothetical protein [Pseudomonas sp. 21LCFQ010]MCO8170193.1 hypothetical protein [Pseudomonas sp. 21LCFQ02]MCQ9424622.1 hypothetical protein [Pseudomonas sp. LJDD11]BAP43311.1 putative uncharacterized protein [Pseudomonas sp. StFLB209]